MKIPFKLRILSLATIASLGASGLFAGASAQASEAEVRLLHAACGSECVMVFARVGERFEYDFSEGEGKARVRLGKNAAGEESRVPFGLRFFKKAGRLEGVPQRSGFHEFVVTRRAAGLWREKVVLIDVQEHALSAGIQNHAAYFARGVRLDPSLGFEWKR